MVTQYLRVNYRLTGGHQDIDYLQSQLVKFRVTCEIDSAHCVISFSMEGWGRPSWVMIQPVSHYPTVIVVNHPYAGAASLYHASVYGYPYNGASIGFGPGLSGGATVSYAFDIYALIGSR